MQRILLELLNQMDGFDQNVNVKVSSVLSEEAFNFPSVAAPFLSERCAVTVAALATSPLCLVLIHAALAEVPLKVSVQKNAGFFGCG